jgi:hypothetical protein
MTDPFEPTAEDRRDADDDEVGTPRWVKVSGAIALLVVVLLVILKLIGGGEHGPGRHAPADGAGHTPPPGVSHSTQQP